MEGDGIEMFGDIASRGGVEIDKVDGWHFIVALIAWDEYPFKCAAATDAAVGAVDVVVDLRVVNFKNFGEVDLRGINEHEITTTAHRKAVSDGLVGSHFAGVNVTFHVETADGTVESVGCGGQWLDVDTETVGL